MTNERVPTWQVVAVLALALFVMSVVVWFGVPAFSHWAHGTPADCTSEPYATGCPYHEQVD